MELKESELGPKRTTLPVHRLCVSMHVGSLFLIILDRLRGGSRLAVSLVYAPKLQVSITLICVPKHVDV